jgi:hypothetical protein
MSAVLNYSNECDCVAIVVVFTNASKAFKSTLPPDFDDSDPTGTHNCLVQPTYTHPGSRSWAAISCLLNVWLPENTTCITVQFRKASELRQYFPTMEEP